GDCTHHRHRPRNGEIPPPLRHGQAAQHADRMNTGTDHDPLDADEAELAKRLHALPGGLPGPELDARIRARAHAAVAARRRPVRPWLWGLSSAAVAVLAVGLFWKAGLPPDGLNREAGDPAAAR